MVCTVVMYLCSYRNKRTRNLQMMTMMMMMMMMMMIDDAMLISIISIRCAQRTEKGCNDLYLY